MQRTLHLVLCSFQADTLNCQQESGNSCGLWEGFWDILGPAIIVFFQQSSRLISPTLKVVVLYLLPKEGDLQQIQIDSLCHCLTPTIKSC